MWIGWQSSQRYQGFGVHIVAFLDRLLPRNWREAETSNRVFSVTKLFWVPRIWGQAKSDS